MLDINLDEHKTSDKKIIINSKTIQLENNVYSTIKCYKSLTDIETLETKCLNIIKIHKTIYLNLPNLTAIDMRENRLCKISKNFKLFKLTIKLVPGISFKIFPLIKEVEGLPCI